jgi:hypothetical protein
MTPHGEIHLLIGNLAAVIAVLSAFVYALALKGKKGWEGFWQHSLLSGLLMVAIMPVFASSQGSAGFRERVLVGIIFLWEEVLALRLYFLVGRERGGSLLNPPGLPPAGEAA